MTTITFTNIDFQPITQQQTALLSEYCKVFSENGNRKKIEFYENGEIESIEYYKSNNESISSIFTLLGTNTLDIISTEVYNEYFIKIKTSYTNGVPLLDEKTLLLNNKVICFLEMDSEENIDYSFSRKYLHLDGENFLFFIYNTDGSLRQVGGNTYPFSEYNQFIEASELEDYFPGLLINNPYYADATFLP